MQYNCLALLKNRNRDLDVIKTEIFRVAKHELFRTMWQVY